MSRAESRAEPIVKPSHVERRARAKSVPSTPAETQHSRDVHSTAVASTIQTSRAAAWAEPRMPACR
eukprot:CAMPEP_0174751910 /NCGR_PEP_ID=MMETSP1094-20130205/100821_1 /TAXON_ID=156173 /ORGANISM="Chrysochromulina brevifilum, Strain UTEX LB 985" /LENGTH=65 /DNA_ID=CAMNT_0015957465 /DNA_START=239 /DNA_END=433 /DNA_ORIENTATION=-